MGDIKDKDKGSVSEVTALPNQKAAEREATERFILIRLAEKSGKWAEENPVKTMVGVGIVTPLVATRVVAPAYDWAKKGIFSLFSRKVEEKVSEKIAGEAKNAIGIGDMMGFVAGSVGTLVKHVK